jgi:predicted enzyme related to lactoylglutathione lyase
MTTVLVNVDVDDLEKATRFYTEVFGLSIGRRFGPYATELLGGGAPIYLLVKKAETPPFPGASQLRSYQRHWTPVHIDFAVDDIDQMLARAEAAGATREGPVKDHKWGRIAMLADPFGNGFCLIQFSALGYDAVATG